MILEKTFCRKLFPGFRSRIWGNPSAFPNLGLLLIDTPYFVKQHLSVNSVKEQCLIFESSESSSKKNICLWKPRTPPVIVHTTEIPGRRSLKNSEKEKNFDPKTIKFHEFTKSMSVAGSINGLVCLYHKRELMQDKC